MIIDEHSNALSFIEIKSGRVGIENGHWTTRDHRDPIDQVDTLATRATDELIQFLQEECQIEDAQRRIFKYRYIWLPETEKHDLDLREISDERQRFILGQSDDAIATVLFTPQHRPKCNASRLALENHCGVILDYFDGNANRSKQVISDIGIIRTLLEHHSVIGKMDPDRDASPSSPSDSYRTISAEEAASSQKAAKRKLALLAVVVWVLAILALLDISGGSDEKSMNLHTPSKTQQHLAAPQAENNWIKSTRSLDAAYSFGPGNSVSWHDRHANVSGTLEFIEAHGEKKCGRLIVYKRQGNKTHTDRVVANVCRKNGGWRTID